MSQADVVIDSAANAYRLLTSRGGELMLAGLAVDVERSTDVQMVLVGSRTLVVLTARACDDRHCVADSHLLQRESGGVVPEP